MKLLIIRHGKTDANLQNLVQGSGIDMPLNAIGAMEAETAGFNLKSLYKLPVIYCSCLLRARQTADILAPYFKAEVMPLKGLEEVNFGDAEGMASTDARQKYREVFETINDESNPLAAEAKIPNGESVSESLSRGLAALECIKTMTSAPMAGVVTHGSLMFNLYKYFFHQEKVFDNLEYFEIEI